MGVCMVRLTCLAGRVDVLAWPGAVRLALCRARSPHTYYRIDITCMCVSLLRRHGFLLAAVNMPTGERWAYAVFLLHILLCRNNVLPFVAMYDINCR